MPKLPANRKLIYAGAGVAILIALYTMLRGRGSSAAAASSAPGQDPASQALAAGWIPPGSSTFADNSASLGQFSSQVAAQTNQLDTFSQGLSNLSNFLASQPMPSPTPPADGGSQTLTALALQSEADLVGAVTAAIGGGAPAAADPAGGKFKVNQVYGRNGRSGGYTYLGGWNWRGAQGKVKHSVGHPPQGS